MFNDLLDEFLKLRLAPGTKRAYKSGVDYWQTFTKSIGVSEFTRDVNVGVYFALTRCFGHRIKSQTIKGNFSAIAEFYRANGHEAVHWAEKSYKIGYIYKVIDKINPSGKGKIAITEELLERAMHVMDLSIWSHYALYSAKVLAYSFALRACEYTETKDYEPPLLQNIKIITTRNRNKALVFTIIKSKNSQSTKIPEIVKSSCCCPRLCAFHHFSKYLSWRIAINDQLPDSVKPYLFVWSGSTFLKFKKNNNWNASPNLNLKNPSSFVPIRYGRYRKVSGSVFDEAVGKNHGVLPHGYRYGGITDLARMGLSDCVIRGISRHAPNSPILHRYIRLEPDHIAELIAQKKKEEDDF